MNTETLMRGEIRYCPVCIAEALGSGARPWEIVHEAHWQFIHIRSCWRHNVRLESFRPPTDASSRFDFSAFVRRYTRDLPGREVHASAEADALDTYLSNRAYGNLADHWCNCLEIPALAKACEAFGVLIDHGREVRGSYLAREERRDTMLTGFRVLSSGPDGIREVLDRFKGRIATRGGKQPHPRTGEVQMLLGSYTKHRTDLAPLRDVVRDYFLDNYPFRAGSTVLGQKIAETRVFSLRSARREIGIRASLLEEILIRRGMAHRNEAGELSLDVVLTRALVADLRREKFDYLDQNQTVEVLGCTFAMFKQLQLAGILRAEEGADPYSRKGFYRHSLLTFLNTLGGSTEMVEFAGGRLFTLDIATRKAKCSVPDIIELVLGGKLRLRARMSERIRLDTLLVDIFDLSQALATRQPNGFSKSDVKARLFIDDRTLNHLLELKLLATSRMRHSITRVTHDYLTVNSVSEFINNYVTSGMFAREHDLNAQFARAALRKAASSITHEPATRPVYRRADVIGLCSQLLSSKREGEDATGKRGRKSDA